MCCLATCSVKNHVEKTLRCKVGTHYQKLKNLGRLKIGVLDRSWEDCAATVIEEKEALCSPEVLSTGCLRMPTQSICN